MEKYEENQIQIKENTTSAFVVLSKPIRERAITIVNQKRQKGEIPTGMREKFLEDLLEQHQCICERPITENSPEEAAIKRRLLYTKPGALEDLILNLSGRLDTLSRESERHIKELKMLGRNKIDIESEKEQVEEELRLIHEKIKIVDMEDIGDLELKRKGFKSRLQDLIEEISSVSHEMDRKSSDLKGLKDRIRNAEAREEKSKELRKKSEIADKSLASLQRLEKEFIGEMRKEIQERSQDIFNKLIWKNSQFSSVIISDNFELEVLDRWGMAARRELSAGERQCFSLAFILAMSKTTHAEAPFIMDTPFARISEVPLRNISENLPKLTEQLILLVTRKEFPPEYSNCMRDNIGRIYNLHFDDSIGSTTIEEVKS